LRRFRGSRLCIHPDHPKETHMAALDDLRKALADSNSAADAAGATIAEIASDIDDLIAKLAAGTPGSEEVRQATEEAAALTAKLTATAATLTETASKHTP
jgi:hypothetical protein